MNIINLTDNSQKADIIHTYNVDSKHALIIDNGKFIISNKMLEF